MKIQHDKEANALMVIFNERNVHSHKAVTDAVIVNFDENNMIVSLELLAVSKVVDIPNSFEYTDITHPRYYADKMDNIDLEKLLDKRGG